MKVPRDVEEDHLELGAIAQYRFPDADLDAPAV
jgi:hypothetical protein